MHTKSTPDPIGMGQYAEVNGINLYYETHGRGRPLIPAAWRSHVGPGCSRPSFRR